MNKFLKKHGILFSIILFFIVASIFLAKFLSLDGAMINDVLKDVPRGYASVFFTLLYVASNFFLFWDLKDLLKPVGAVFFGAYISTVCIFIAEIINAYIFFTVSRRLGITFAQKYLTKRFKRLYINLGDMKLGWIMVLRTILLVPYRVLDISFGLSEVPLGRYMLAVCLASIPRIFWIQFILASINGFSVERLMSYYSEHMVVTGIGFFYLIYSVTVAIMAGRKLLR